MQENFDKTRIAGSIAAILNTRTPEKLPLQRRTPLVVFVLLLLSTGFVANTWTSGVSADSTPILNFDIGCPNNLSPIAPTVQWRCDTATGPSSGNKFSFGGGTFPASGNISVGDVIRVVLWFYGTASAQAGFTLKNNETGQVIATGETQSFTATGTNCSSATEVTYQSTASSKQSVRFGDILVLVLVLALITSGQVTICTGPTTNSGIEVFSPISSTSTSTSSSTQSASGTGGLSTQVEYSIIVLVAILIIAVAVIWYYYFYGDDDDDDEGPESGCFIATAAYGSAMHPHVELLRRYRDEVLMRSRYSQKFEAILKEYYRFSPPIAKAMNRNRPLKTLVRYTVVLPIVFSLRGTPYLIKGERSRRKGTTARSSD